MRTIRSSVDLNADDRRRIEEDWPEGADTALVEARDGWLEVRFVRTPKRFERIRRITGYLVGDMTRWNDAKKAEERDRVTHALAGEERKERREESEAKGEKGMGEEAKEKARCAVGLLLCMAGLAALAWYWEGGL